ncbi:MAG: YetF domain-containing protein [Parvularcula sp.]|jgi:uncharacterized membrane protein YcaP (DUF421 family)|nr:YetF domain-containing protein [Parvularcula sp.]
MFFSDAPHLDLLVRTLILGPTCLLVVVIATRMIGLRSFSKMTAFDFVSTVAIGSLLANAAVATEWLAFLQTTGAVVSILSLQVILALLRLNSRRAAKLLSNDPVVLMKNGIWDNAAMQQSRTSKTDIWAKMREANVSDPGSVNAVILESTGDVSVLHGDMLNCELLTGVAHRGQ